MKDEGEREPVGVVDRWAEALTWYGTLRDARTQELTEAVGREWQHWYTDAANRRIFDAVSRLMADRSLYRERSRLKQTTLERDSYDLNVPIAEWLRTQPRRESGNRPSTRRPSLWWWVTGGIGATAITALFVLWPSWFWSGGGSAMPAIYQTHVGAISEVQLRDGSDIILGGRTKLAVTFSARQRTVNLIAGQAWFHVAHNPRWPFIVIAGDGTITDVGTAFLVTRDSDRVVVTVTEGTVSVSASSATQFRFKLGQALIARPHLGAMRVSRGEELAFNDNGGLGSVEQADTRAATAWTNGRLTFDNQPLRYVIEAVNRYSSRHIVVSPAAGKLRFSGIVFDDEVGNWLQNLQLIFPITIEEQGSNVRVEMHDSTQPRNEPPYQRQP